MDQEDLQDVPVVVADAVMDSVASSPQKRGGNPWRTTETS